MLFTGTVLEVLLAIVMIKVLFDLDHVLMNAVHLNTLFGLLSLHQHFSKTAYLEGFPGYCAVIFVSPETVLVGIHFKSNFSRATTFSQLVI